MRQKCNNGESDKSNRKMSGCQMSHTRRLEMSNLSGKLPNAWGYRLV